MRTLIGINTLTVLDQLAYANHMQWFYRLGKIHGNNHEFGLMTPRRSTIDRMRNETVRIALESNFDYVMFIDDDILLPMDIDVWDKMVKADKDVIAGWTIIRGYPYDNMFFKGNIDAKSGEATLDHFNDFNDYIDADGLVPCDAIGCSLVLFKTALFKKIPPPYFVTGTRNTEDIYFCIKARKYVPDCTIYVDPSIKTGHLLGTQVVSPDNAARWRESDEFEDPSVKNKIKEDRGDNYNNMVHAVIGANNG